MIRLHFRAKIEFCTQSCPILKNTLNYIFQINIGPFSLVCHLPETLSDPQTYLYTIDIFYYPPVYSLQPFILPILSFFSPLLWRPNNFVMLHLLQPSTYEIIPHHMTCSLIRAKTYIVNRFLSPHQCSIIQDMRPCFRCKRNKRCYSGIRRQALTAAATVFTVTDLNVRLCCEVIICEINACALLR